ncbi:hypothetical protein E2C01_037023 [Portunus trituberculatus]
MQTDA